ncbi:MAG: cytochrome C [Beijerinckiaceae bacterium]|nr:cytochrome C [Beijerinckiaceae bacterium]
MTQAAAQNATAQSAAAGAQSSPPPGATSCLGCHAGADNALPSLKGRSASDIEAAMIAFRTGAREATVMDRLAKGFDEAETRAISAWLANGGAGK